MFRLFLILIVFCFSSVFVSAQTQQSQQITQSVNITNRPSPIYTEKAREKGIEGTVKLKVTFLSSGEVGDVIFLGGSSKKNDLKKYGLVDEAIAAAKKIKFEPATRNGQPIAVTKVIIYTFTLF